MKHVETLQGNGRLTSGSGSHVAGYRVDFWVNAAGDMFAMGSVDVDSASGFCGVGEEATLALGDGRVLKVGFLAGSPSGALFMSTAMVEEQEA